MGCDNKFMKGCAGKIKHTNWLAANYFLENEHADPAALIYKCKCGSFHIGSRLNSGKKIIKHKKRENEQQHKRKHKRFKY
jgi:hypothetical protein